MDFRHTGFDRQSKMTAKFLADTSLQHQVQNIWVFVMKMGKNAPPPKEDPVPPIMRSVQAAVDKIRARGGGGVFLRHPSSGPFWGGEPHALLRTKTLDS